ncbi:DUF5317 domain-containing protein [Neobacillus mesonae]|nr:DUF5317 domain-containing protein [Neobacillus mesonae]
MVYDGIILGLIVGLFRGGLKNGLTQFGQIKLRGGLIFPILLLIQFIIFRFQGDAAWLAPVSGYFFMFLYVVGLFFLWVNRQNKGFIIILIGVFLNFIVMAVNGGRMPVSLEAAQVLGPYYTELLTSGDAVYKHYMLDASTRLSFLGDIIPLSSPYPRTQVISIGDVVMNLGIFLYIQSIMVPPKKDSEDQDLAPSLHTSN